MRPEGRAWLDASLSAKLDALTALLSDLGSMVVAFSGGVDSTLLLRVVSEVPGVRAIAVTTDSPTTPRGDLLEARALARAFGAPHRVVVVDELETPGYSENAPNRCYLCKQTLYPLCLRIAAAEHLAYVVDGVNLDDLGDYRPGLTAAVELGVHHPLVEAGLSKAEIRRLSRAYDLPTADKPASPCLSSRFPYGTRITREGLDQVARAEAALHDLGLHELRVRHLGDSARVEVGTDDLSRLNDHELRSAASARVLAAGFARVEISERPFRSGSLNDVLSMIDLERASDPRRG